MLRCIFTFATVLCCTLVYGQGDIESLINSVFTKPSTEGTTSRFNLQPNLGGIPGTGDCICVPYYLCTNGTINTNGEGIVDIRINDGPCGTNYMEVCCNTDDIATKPIEPTPPPIGAPTGCGYRHANGMGIRITGDNENESQFAEFPWMVALLREETINGNPNKLNVYQCGGALIHPQMVVTAAHCVIAKNRTFKIRAGEWDTQHTEELYPHQDRAVQSITIHPEYYSGGLYNDIAVIVLKQPFVLAENVDVICLPKQGLVTPDARCFATGWGKDVFGKKGKYQVILKKIDLPVVQNSKCQEKLRKTRLGAYFRLHSSFICAGGEPDKDTCKGDGGSPLVCPIPGEKDRYYQAGIVAWGIGCGESDVPGVYVNVAAFRDWIDQQMRRNNFDVNSYVY